MDTRKYMVIDTSKRGKKGMFITSRIADLTPDGGVWKVTFAMSPTIYTYRKERIELLKHPEVVDVSDHGFYLRNQHIRNVEQLYRFTDQWGRCYYHVITSSGREHDYEEREVYVTRTRLDACSGGVWRYLCHLAAETGLVLDEVGNILKMQYDIVDVMRDNVPLAQYLGDKKPLNVYDLPRQVVYPFGCNASQKQGVENALTHQVSIIQGPPGTGKTQTILNIIANLLMARKSVLVVSNNNSAVENVQEKLASDEVGLAFIVAQLGSKEHKEAFVANQPEVPDMSEWKKTDARLTSRRVAECLQLVSKGFDNQTRVAVLQRELEALKTEQQYKATDDTARSEYYAWLKKMPSEKLMKLKCDCEKMYEHERKPHLLFYLRWMFALGYRAWNLLHLPYEEYRGDLEAAYYDARRHELEGEIARCEEVLRTTDIPKNTASLRGASMQLLHYYISDRWNDHVRPTFTVKDIKPKSEAFLQEYPVVLSTTYAAKNCINRDRVFDYVIMDEASQVDIATGALALSCAMNAVIVGDDKQLPNVVDDKTRNILTKLEKAYKVDDTYCSSTHNFLQSCCEVFTDAPQTLLREHYRCHPKIIEFCNQMFYDGQLIPMTKDKGEKDVIRIIRTAEGNHARGHYNQREIDVIATEVMPTLRAVKSWGIITPYRLQAESINKALQCDVASTVHKYQGRECEHIVMSMVDNEVSEFADDANLMNVAISRAKNGLTIVTNGNKVPEKSNLGKLIAYANYHNFEVSDSALHSIFDLLYKPYTQERLAWESKKMKKVSDELSENLIYALLQQCITRLKTAHTDIICHYPLSYLIGDMERLSDEERAFALNMRTHIDFLVYDTLTKRPVLCVEVDGWGYHHSEVQMKRDQLKDAILAKYGLPMLRLSTVQMVTEESLTNDLSRWLKPA